MKRILSLLSHGLFAAIAITVIFFVVRYLPSETATTNDPSTRSSAPDPDRQQQWQQGVDKLLQDAQTEQNYRQYLQDKEGREQREREEAEQKLAESRRLEQERLEKLERDQPRLLDERCQFWWQAHEQQPSGKTAQMKQRYCPH